MGSSSSSQSVSNSSSNCSESVSAYSVASSTILYRSVFGQDGIVERNETTRNSTWRADITDKLNKQKSENPNLESDIKSKYGLDLFSFVTALGDKEMFKKTFLNPSLNNDQILEEIKEEMEQIAEYSLTEEEVKRALNRMNEKKEKLSKFQLRLLLTSCGASEKSIIRKAAILDKKFEFGALHAALSVNGVVLEWGRGLGGQSLVCPTLDVLGLLLAIEVEAKGKGWWEEVKNFFNRARDFILNSFKNFGGGWIAGVILEVKLDKIADACIAFNRIKYYDPVRNNCQNFVCEIFRKADIEYKFEGNLKNVIDEIKKTGKCSFIFNDIEFLTRADLDSFVMGIDFGRLSDSDKRLLFAYKHVFDQYLKCDEKNIKYQTSASAENHWKILFLDYKFD